jgi:3-hydroxy-3-methylglutaryl CoA synthase
VERVLGIAAASAYVPRAYVERSLLAAAWGVPALPGRRSAAGPDEDSLTLAVEAGRRALEAAALDPGAIDLLVLASTTLPYQERQNAGLAAAALDLRHDARTADVTGSLRCGLDATALAGDAIRAGSARYALVLAADCRLAVPGTSSEQSFGDGGAALLLASDGALATIAGFAATHRSEATRWRSSDDPLVRTYEARLEKVSGYGRELPAAARAAMASAGVSEQGEAVRA